MRNKPIITIFISCLLLLTGLNGCGIGESEEQITTRESIMACINENNLIPEEWVEITAAHPWGTESTNSSAFEYFYIDADDYDTYESEWDFDDIDESELVEGYNSEKYDYYMYEVDEPVFHSLAVTPLCYKEDVEYGNLLLEKDVTYYLVGIYERAVYCEYVSSVSQVSGATSFNYWADYDSKTAIGKYMIHQEQDDWICEELQ